MAPKKKKEVSAKKAKVQDFDWSEKNNMPLGVKTVAVLYFIGAMFNLLIGMAMILNPSGSLRSLDVFIPEILISFTGILMLIFSAVGYFVGKGLWTGQEWSRKTAIMLSVAGVISQLMFLFSGTSFVFSLFWIAVCTIYVLTGAYLVIDRKVKKVFVNE